MSALSTRKQRFAHSIKPVAELVADIGAQYIWFPMHDASGTTLTEETGSIAGFSGMAIAGTTTNLWGNRGWATGRGSADGADPFARSTNANLAAFLRPDTLNGGKLLLSCWFRTPPGGVTAQNTLFQYGGVTTAAAGFLIGVTAADRPFIQARNAGFTSILATAVATITPETKTHLAFTLDGSLNLATYVDAVADAANTGSGTVFGDLSSVGACSLAGMNAAGAINNSAVMQLNTQMSDLIIMRVPSASVANIPQIVSELSKYRTEIPPKLSEYC